tara:strand:+ start:84530 stop:86275 length:1746 start_codon:yes stop_codon:yes gene_type:complete
MITLSTVPYTAPLNDGSSCEEDAVQSKINKALQGFLEKGWEDFSREIGDCYNWIGAIAWGSSEKRFPEFIHVIARLVLLEEAAKIRFNSSKQSQEDRQDFNRSLVDLAGIYCCLGARAKVDALEVECDFHSLTPESCLERIAHYREVYFELESSSPSEETIAHFEPLARLNTQEFLLDYFSVTDGAYPHMQLENYLLTEVGGSAPRVVLPTIPYTAELSGYDSSDDLEQGVINEALKKLIKKDTADFAKVFTSIQKTIESFWGKYNTLHQRKLMQILKRMLLIEEAVKLRFNASEQTQEDRYAFNKNIMMLAVLYCMMGALEKARSLKALFLNCNEWGKKRCQDYIQQQFEHYVLLKKSEVHQAAVKLLEPVVRLDVYKFLRAVSSATLDWHFRTQYIYRHIRLENYLVLQTEEQKAAYERDQSLLKITKNRSVFGYEKNALGKLTALLDAGGNVEARTEEGWSTPLMQAAEGNRVDMMKVLLERKAKIHAGDIEGDTALHYAAYKGAVGAVQFLLGQKGIKVDALNVKKETPLHYAAGMDSLEVVKLLVERGAKVNACNIYKRKPRGTGEVYRYLLSHGG